jgi:hypothetical protein
VPLRAKTRPASTRQKMKKLILRCIFGLLHKAAFGLIQLIIIMGDRFPAGRLRLLYAQVMAAQAIGAPFAY